MWGKRRCREIAGRPSQPGVASRLSRAARNSIHQIQPFQSQHQNHKYKQLVKAQNHLQAAPQTQRQR